MRPSEAFGRLGAGLDAGAESTMRILHLLASPVWSGPAETVALLARAQRKLGHQVSVAIDRLRLNSGSEEPAKPRFELLELLDDNGLEMSVKSSPAGMLRDMAGLRRVPADVVHAHFSHDHMLAGLALPRRTPLIRSIHAPRSLRRLMPRANGWTVPFDSLSKRLTGRAVLTLPAFVDPMFVPHPNRQDLRNSLAVHGDPVVGMVSTFQPTRRHDLGVAAFDRLRRRHPRAHLVLVGDGELVGTVREDVEARGLSDHVTFAGYQSGSDFVPWLQLLDVVWILGLGNDWSGRAAAQARACGVKVVSVDEGALPSLANELTKPNPTSLMEATERALEAPETKASHIVPDPRDIARHVIQTLYG